MNLWVVDIEGDGLQATKLHCMAATNDSGTFGTIDYDEMRGLLSDTDVIVGHNFQRWDKPTAERILGIEIKAKIVDTLALSWALEPERLKHGLEDWGEEFGVPKPKIEDWHSLSSEEYLHRCEEDTKINWLLWKRFWNLLVRLYDNDEEAIWRYIDYLEFKMDCAAKQEKHKWKLDHELTQKSLNELTIEFEEKTKALAAVMPQVPVISTKKYPAKPLKKNGTLSESGRKWQEFLAEQKLPSNHKEPVDYVSGYEDPNPNSVPQIKDWLFSLGWKPLTFKYKNDPGAPFGSKPRAIPQINKEAQHGGGLCDSIILMFDKHPELKELDSHGVLKHRIGLLNGFLENANEEDEIEAQISGLTNTLRFKHKVIVNLPRTNRPYADAVRGSLVAREGCVLVGADMSSLEDRIKQHFIYKFDPEFVEKVNIDGYDPHIELAVLGKMLTPEQGEAYRKGDKTHKPIRDIAKNGNYACQYGAGAPKISLTTGISLAAAKEVHKAYWKINWGVKAVAEDQKVKTIDDQLWLLNPVNGFYYSLRNEKDIFSTLVQGTGAYCFDVWVGYVLLSYDKLIAQFHDEWVMEVKDTEEEINKLFQIAKDAMEESNIFLQLDRRLDCEVQKGKRYSDIH